MAKKVSKSDIFQGELFREQIEEGKNFEETLREIIGATKQLIETNIQLLKTKSFEDPKQLKEILTAIREVDAATESVTQTEKKRKTILDQIVAAEKKLIQAQSEEGAQLTKIRSEISEVNKRNREQGRIASELFTTYDKMSNKLLTLRREYKDYLALQAQGKKLDKDQIASLNALEKEYSELDTQLKNIDARAGQFNRNVGNYKSGFNGLGNSINQLTREAPAFAHSMEIGFLAISNNIPIAADEINKLRAANKLLASEGKATTSIMGQIGRAIFSWQTLLSVGVTLLTLFGAKLFEWVANIKTGGREILNLRDAQRKLNEALSENAGSLAKERAELELLLKVAKDKNATEEDRLEAVERLNELSPEHISNITLENIETEKVTRQVEKYTKSLDAAAKTQAAMDVLTELYTKKIQAQRDGVTKSSIAWASFKGAIATAMGTFKSAEVFLEGMNDAVAAPGKAAKAAQKDIEEFLASLSGMGIDLDKIFGKLGKAGTEIRLENLELLKAELELERARYGGDRVTIFEREIDLLKVRKKVLEDELQIKLKDIKDPKIVANLTEEVSLRKQMLDVEIANTALKHEKFKAEREDLMILERKVERTKEQQELLDKSSKKLEDDYDRDRRVEKSRSNILVLEKEISLELAKQRGDKTRILVAEEELKQAKIKQIETERDLAIENDKLSEAEREEIRKRADLEILRLNEVKDATLSVNDEIKQSYIDLTNAIIEAAKRRNEAEKELTDLRLGRTSKEVDRQTQLASQGYANTLAFEQKKQADLELLQEKQAQKAERLAKIQAYFNAVAAYSKDDPNTAPLKALAQTLIAEKIAGFFYGGAENVGEALGNKGKAHGGKDGYRGVIKGTNQLIGFDGEERIMSPSQNHKTGNFSNEELADLAFGVRTGRLSVVPTDAQSDGANGGRHYGSDVERLSREIRSSRPTVNFNWASLHEVIEKRISEEGERIIRHVSSGRRRLNG